MSTPPRSVDFTSIEVMSENRKTCLLRMSIFISQHDISLGGLQNMLLHIYKHGYVHSSQPPSEAYAEACSQQYIQVVETYCVLYMHSLSLMSAGIDSRLDGQPMPGYIWLSAVAGCSHIKCYNPGAGQELPGQPGVPDHTRSGDMEAFPCLNGGGGLQC